MRAQVIGIPRQNKNHPYSFNFAHNSVLMSTSLIKTRSSRGSGGVPSNEKPRIGTGTRHIQIKSPSPIIGGRSNNDDPRFRRASVHWVNATNPKHWRTFKQYSRASRISFISVMSASRCTPIEQGIVLKCAATVAAVVSARRTVVESGSGADP